MVVRVFDETRSALHFFPPTNSTLVILRTRPRILELYLDALMFLHDYVCELSQMQEGPRLETVEIEDRFVETYDQLSPNELGDTNGLVQQNLHSNVEVAEQIRQMAQTSTFLFDLEETANRFIQGLLETYLHLAARHT